MTEHLLDQITMGPLIIVREKMMALQASGKKVYRLEAGDTSFDTPPHIRKAITDALESGKTHYPVLTGIPPLREAMLTKVRTQNHLPIRDAENVMVTVGGMQGLYITFGAMLSPGDQVILPDPVWGETPELIRRTGAVPVLVKLHAESDFSFEAADIETAITPRTKAVYLNSPHNPVGVMLSEAQLRAIADVAIKHNLFVVSDEAYETVLFDGNKHISIGSLPGMGDRTISVFSFSKTYAMTGLRMGYAVTNDDVLLDRMRKLIRLTTGGVSSIVQWGGVAAMTGPQTATQEMTAEMQRRRDIFYNGVKSIPAFESFKPQGAFYVWAKISDKWNGYQGKKDGWAMTNFLIDRAGIGASPGVAFGENENYLRFAFTGEAEMLAESVQVMQDLF
ncbi:MAG: aminotransferase class I/II-fold pyridoxal phosphate-dependent enzyme [Chloroflexi bacterium]|nr:aminotransferase class I/II-fold pyridoxal phosphate-dependent enzyme [Chloroflexota bacterium]